MMDNSTTEVFNEIRTTIEKLRAQIDELEGRIYKETGFDIGDIEIDLAPESFSDSSPAPLEEPAPEPVAAPAPEPLEAIEPEPAPEPLEAPEAIDLSIDMDAIGAKPLPDLKSFQWMIDIPGSEVANVISAISLNDRVLFINTLFREDPILFQNTIAAFNKMSGIIEAVSYILANFPDWKLNSEVVYRLMMAVRRKLK